MQGMATRRRSLSNMNIVRPETLFAAVQARAGHTDAVLLLYRIHRVVKTYHIFSPLSHGGEATVDRGSWVQVIGNLLLADSARMFNNRAYLRCPV